MEIGAIGKSKYRDRECSKNKPTEQQRQTPVPFLDTFQRQSAQSAQTEQSAQSAYSSRSVQSAQSVISANLI